MAIADQVLPPTINLLEPDPACDLNYVPGIPRGAIIEHAISDSLGFGGTNATIAFSKFKG